MDTSILEDLGLSKGEIKVYLTLLELGPNKVGRIIEKSNMASSAVHNSVNSLIDKGLISFIKKGKVKHYQAVPPKQLMDFVETKKQKLQQILPQLELKQKLSEEKQEAEVFVGAKGIIVLLNLLIEDTHKGDDYVFFSINVKEHNEEIQKFMLSYDLKRKERGLKIRGLAPKKMRQLFQSRKFLDMRYSTFPIPSNISVCNDKIAFFSWGEKPVGYLIKSKQIATMYKEFFESVWGLAK